MSDENNDRPTNTPPPLVPPSDNPDEQGAAPEYSQSASESTPRELADDPDVHDDDRASTPAAVPFGSDQPVTVDPPALEEPDVAARPSLHDESVNAAAARSEPTRVDPATGKSAHDDTSHDDGSHDDRHDEPITVVHPTTPPVAAPQPTPVAAQEDNQYAAQQQPIQQQSSHQQPVHQPTQQYGAQQQPLRPFRPAPIEPRKKGNRGAGALIAILSVIIFAVLYAAVAALIIAVGAPGESVIATLTLFFSDPVFYVPAIFFVIGFVIVVLLANRASWWAYVLGSLFVGLLVYFGAIGAGLLTENAFAMTPGEASAQFVAFAANPFVIAAALVAREVSLWMGAAISARGRRIKARNVAAREEFERATAEHRAEYERGYAPTS